MGFFYSFTATLINSLWQSGVLLLLYFIAGTATGKLHPLQKRNLLYGLLGAQLVLSFITLLFYLDHPSASYFSGLEILDESGIFSPSSAWHPLIVFVYLTALVFKLTGIILKRRAFNARFTSGRIRPGAALKLFTALKAYHFGINRKVTLWYSHNINTPLTFGFLKPVILLPVSLVNALSLRETEAIILHELAHIKNRDYLLNLFLVITENVFFFNPFIKILSDKLKLEREKNCDLQVINFDYPELLYAEALLKTARSSRPVRTFQISAVNRLPELLQRICFFSDESNATYRRIPAFPAALFILLFVTALLMFLPNFKTGLQEKTALQTTLPVAYELGGPVRYPRPERILRNIPAAKDKAAAYRVAAVTESDVEIIDAEEYPKESPNDIFRAIPAEYTESSDSAKEFIYRIETQEGNFIQSFKLRLENGQWVMQPQWMMLETKPDSLKQHVIIDSPVLPQ